MSEGAGKGGGGGGGGGRGEAVGGGGRGEGGGGTCAVYTGSVAELPLEQSHTEIVCGPSSAESVTSCIASCDMSIALTPFGCGDGIVLTGKPV